MATYYRWRKSTVKYTETNQTINASETKTILSPNNNDFFELQEKPSVSNGKYSSAGGIEKNLSGGPINIQNGTYLLDNQIRNICYLSQSDGQVIESGFEIFLYSGIFVQYTINSFPDTFVEYVYSITASAYPNGGVSGSYWYDQRTTITSPTAPTNIQYPNPITTPTVAVNWGAATSNVPSYSVSKYELSYALDGGGTWKSVGTTSKTNLEAAIPVRSKTIKFRVRAQDSNGQWSSYATGTASTVLLSPTLTVPSMAMQGQSIPVSWTAVDGATGYTLQRKADTDIDWVEVYTGQDLEFSEEVGAWSTVQYRVQAVFSVGPGGWATSASIPVVSASALVISGQNEDLGTLTKDVPYTVSSDTGNPITLIRKVNGNLVATLTIQSGFAYTIPVMDLPTGSGTIEISATVNAASGGPVSATRTWTYTKTAITFPNRAGVGQLTREDDNVFPITLAEAVKVPTNWGGSLDKALELLYPAVNSAVISVGTYEGTGTFGADNPSKLTFDKTPLVVTIYGGGQTLVISSTAPGSTAYISGNQAVWYSAESSAAQMNTDGTTYSYVAVGKQV